MRFGVGVCVPLRALVDVKVGLRDIVDVVDPEVVLLLYTQQIQRDGFCTILVQVVLLLYTTHTTVA